MQTWEHYLTKSLRQDILDLSDLAAQISTMVSSNSICTWLNPNKLYSEIETPRCDGYVQCLEALLDKLYFVMNLLLLYVTQGAVGSRNVAKPPKLSMFRCVELLWTKLKEYTGKRPTAAARLPTGKEMGVQTVTKVEDECRDCSENLGLIKNITHILQDHREDSHVNIAKRDIQKDLYKLTQAECVHRMHASIEREVKWLLENFQKCKEDLRQSNAQALSSEEDKRVVEVRLEQTIREKLNCVDEMLEFRCKLEELEKKKVEIQENYDLFEVDLVKCKEELDDLRAKYDELLPEKMSAEKKLHLHMMENKELRLSLTHLNKERALLQSSKEGIQKILEYHVKDVKVKYHNNMDCEEKQLRFRQEVDGEIEECRSVLSGFAEKLVDFEDLLRRSERFLVERCEVAEELLRKVWDAVNAAISSKRVKVRHKVTGDPLFDMAGQIEANKRHIAMLTDENASLLRTIARYNSIGPK